MRMNDYGARGAALFDIVNVQIGTRRRISGPFSKLALWPGVAARSLCQFSQGLA
jgi:hypothetical protein